MGTAVHALLLFTGWAFVLVATIFAYRGLRILGGTAINSWPRGVKNTGDAGLVTRIADAHANTLENLPIFAVLVLAAVALNKTAVTDPLAMYVVYARLGQSTAHLIGTGPLLVTVRATFWAAQLVLFGLMFYGLLH